MEGHQLTRADLQRFTEAITTALTALTDEVRTLTTQINNTNQSRNREGEWNRDPRAGNNRFVFENSSSDEEDPIEYRIDQRN